MTARLSGSGLLRAAKCPPSYALPVVHMERKDTSASRSRGSCVHDYLMHVLQGSVREDALAQVPEEHRSWCEHIDVYALAPGGETEVPVAFDTRTGLVRRLDSSGHRDYSSVMDWEIPGQMDYALPRIGSDRPSVTDWKSSAFDLNVDAAMVQLRFYGYCWATLLDETEVELRVAQINAEGRIYWHTETLDSDRLDDLSAYFKDIYSRVIKERLNAKTLPRYQPDVSMGPHCSYCEAWHHCPGMRASVSLALGTEPESLVTPQLVADAWVRAKRAEKVVDKIKDTVKRALGECTILESSDGQMIRRDSQGKILTASAGSDQSKRAAAKAKRKTA